MLGRPLHALLFAVMPVLFLYAHNAPKLAPRDLALALPATALAAGIVFLLLRVLLRDGRRAGLAATVFWLWFFSWGPLRHGESLLGSGLIGAEWLLAAIWTGVLLVALWGVSRLRRDLRPATRLLNMVGLGLVLLQVAMAAPAVWRQAHRQYPVPDLAGYHSHRPAGGKLPNIYFIVLDGYARADVLRERYGFDNGPFLDFLRQRGFYVADRSSANYFTTLMSLPATLNMDYLDPLARAAGRQCSDVKPAVAYVERNRVCRLLRAAGYRTVANYCGWSDWEMSSADLFQGRPVLGNFERQVLEWTPLAALGSHDELTAHRWRIRHPLEHLATPRSCRGPCSLSSTCCARTRPLSSCPTAGPGRPHSPSWTS